MRSRVSVLLLVMGALAHIASGKPLKILLVSPYPAGAAERGVKTLLDQHGAKVSITQWNRCHVRIARGFDLVIVGGQRRAMVGQDALRGYQGPVLGMGSFGSAYFGTYKLKHGLPYS